VVITDIMLPGMDGLALTDFIKKNFDTDVIVMTGYSADYSYAEAVSKGASDFVFKPVRFDELLLRLKRVVREREYTHERDRMLKKLEKLAITDGLTKLFNSRHFYYQLEVEAGRAQRYNHALSLLLLDIDFFKKYNDRHGHLAGDMVLVRIGQIIKSCLRTIDTAYRYGGEEFTVILPETSGPEAVTVAQRIGAAVRREIFHPVPDHPVTITISTGVAEYQPREALTGFVQRADRAMYLSKEKGRDSVSFLPVDEPA
jgi:diguanylate cyclase (GGDEF)-like protein